MDGVFRGCFGEEQTSVTAADWQQLVEARGEKPDLLGFYQTWLLENFASAAEAFASFGAEEVPIPVFLHKLMLCTTDAT